MSADISSGRERAAAAGREREAHSNGSLAGERVSPDGSLGQGDQGEEEEEEGVRTRWGTLGFVYYLHPGLLWRVDVAYAVPLVRRDDGALTEP